MHHCVPSNSSFDFSFRISAAERLGFWDNITQFYELPSAERHKVNYLDYMNYTTMIKLAHQKEDMIKE
jgi:hypothetical protein